jgi:hypothetical protein
MSPQAMSGITLIMRTDRRSNDFRQGQGQGKAVIQWLMGLAAQ